MEFEKMLELFGMLLLAAVIITFLMPQRAWGETSLRNLFTGQTENNNDGDIALGHKALDVKLDVENSANPNVYEFHMTDQGVYGNKHLIYEESLIGKTYFTIRNWNKDKCTLFTTRKIPDILSLDIYEDFNYVYYINAGTIIDSTCGSLDNCLKGNVFSLGCEKICTDFKEDKQPSVFSICGTCWGEGLAKENKVLTQPFGAGVDYCNEYKDGCPSDANGGCCPLAGQEPSKKYAPQYGLICGYEQVSEKSIDSNAKWFACTNDISSRGRKVFTASAGGFQFKCENGKWVVSGDQGIQISATPQIKQIGLVDEEIEIGFNIQNYREKDISNMVITITPQDKDGKKPSDCFNDDKNPYRELSAIASLKPPPDKASIDEKDFCLDTRKFVVDVIYIYDSKSEAATFKLNCPDTKENDKWFDCTLA